MYRSQVAVGRTGTVYPAVERRTPNWAGALDGTMDIPLPTASAQPSNLPTPIEASIPMTRIRSPSSQKATAVYSDLDDSAHDTALALRYDFGERVEGQSPPSLIEIGANHIARERRVETRRFKFEGLISRMISIRSFGQIILGMSPVSIWLPAQRKLPMITRQNRRSPQRISQAVDLRSN